MPTARGGTRNGRRVAAPVAAPVAVRAAVAHLKRVDPVMKNVIVRVGPCRWSGRSEHTHFGFVLRCIVYQQLSGKAAATIFGRVRELYEGRVPTPEQLIATPTQRLRAAGLSGRKAEYARDLARGVRDGAVPLHSLNAMRDDDVIATLVQVRGIGRWTAQMVLMFQSWTSAFRRRCSACCACAGCRRPSERPRLANAGRRTAPWPRGTCGAVSSFRNDCSHGREWLRGPCRLRGNRIAGRAGDPDRAWQRRRAMAA
jgi:endonuclease III